MMQIMLNYIYLSINYFHKFYTSYTSSFSFLSSNSRSKSYFVFLDLTILLFLVFIFFSEILIS